ncbi:MAG: dienelactone hydrolase family protein [Woeseiaceae bacterium]
MTIKTRPIEYPDEDDTLEACLAWDDAVEGPRPGILVAHTWAGRGDFEDAKARDLAALGYAGFALDLYGKGVRGSGPDECARLIRPFMDDRARLQHRMVRALGMLREQEVVDRNRVAAIGFCFGGLCVLDLARSGENMAGVVSFHGLLGSPGNTSGKRIKARILALHGWDDPMAAPEAVLAFASEVTALGADWQLHAYGNTMHAFTNPKANDRERGTVYNPAAERRSWTAMRNFFDELFDDGA